MTAAPTTLPVHPVFTETRDARVPPATRKRRFGEAFELFSLCHRIALYTDSGRTPPRWLLEELGAHPE